MIVVAAAQKLLTCPLTGKEAEPFVLYWLLAAGFCWAGQGSALLRGMEMLIESLGNKLGVVGMQLPNKPWVEEKQWLQ